MNIEQSRLNLLRSVQDVLKQDIKTYVSGHLNQNKLKLPEAEGRVGQDRWASSSQPQIRYVTFKIMSFANINLLFVRLMMQGNG